MHPNLESLQLQTRRHFFRNCQVGLGSMALASLLDQPSTAAPQSPANPLAVRHRFFFIKGFLSVDRIVLRQNVCLGLPAA